jgi:putative ABC transport system permease protein
MRHQTRHDHRRQVGRFVDVLWRDVRLGLRMIARTPALSLVIGVTLALGIGANTAIFSLFYGILLRPFPYREPERLVRVQSHHASTDNVGENAIADLDDWREQNHTFVDLGIYIPFNTDLLGDGPAQSIRMAWVTPATISLLGVDPLLGRVFVPEEDRPGTDADKCLLSYRIWQTEFGRDPRILDRVVRVSNGTFHVVGIMPPAFHFPDQVDLWAPIQSSFNRSAVQRSQFRGIRPYAVIGRLKPGIALSAAQADLQTIGARLEAQFPTQNAGVRPVLRPLRDVEVGNLRPYLVLILGASGLVLLICCANIANLLFARSTARVREFAIRSALGAPRTSLFRQVLTESLLLSLLGGALGLLVAHVALRVLLRLIPVVLPFWMHVEIDAAALVFNLVASIATGLVFGLTPAFAASTVHLTTLLKHGTGGAGTARFGRLKNALLVAEVALSFVLLVGAGLLVRSFLQLQRMDTGFRSAGLVTARITPFRPGTLSQKIDAYASLYAKVLDELRATPGIDAVGGAVDLPFTGRIDRDAADVSIRGAVPGRDDSARAPTTLFTVSPGYFGVMGIPVLDGRDFREADDQRSLPVVIVSKQTAEILWPGQSPLNRALRLGRATPDNANAWLTVIGVVGSVKNHATDSDRTMELYVPYRQRASGAFSFVTRSRMPAQAMAQALRRAIQTVDKNTAIVSIRNMDEIVADTLWQRRLWGVLLAAFAGLALALTAVGLYALMSFIVRQRTREIGIRLAIGEPPRAIATMILIRGLRLVAIGIIIGGVATYPFTSIVRSLVFGIATSDPTLFALVALVLLMVAVCACVLPTRRVFTVDPVIALRE